MEYEIYLPTQHHCTEACQYVYILGFRCGRNSDYINGQCRQAGKITKHQSPPITSCLESTIWSELNDNGDFLRPNEKVINDDSITIEFNYPLTDTFTFDFHSESGFTRKQLVELIAQTYQKIYQEEEEHETVPERTGPLLNRPATHGPYGIWGHGINDLWLEGITYNPQKKLVTLSIGS